MGGDAKKTFFESATHRHWVTDTNVIRDDSQTTVLASSRQTTYGKPGQHKLHHWRLSWEKKYFVKLSSLKMVGEKKERTELGTYHS